MKSTMTIFVLVCGLALSTLGAPFNRQQAGGDGGNVPSRGGGKNKSKDGAMQDKWAWKMGGVVDATNGEEAQAGVDQRPERPERPEGGTSKGKADFMAATCTTDADCNTDDGEACMSAKPRRFGQKNKGGGGAAADADTDSKVADEDEKEEREQRMVCKVPPTECTTDDDCAELEGTSCVARPQKEGATKEAKFFCRDPDAIRPSKGKGKGGGKGKGKGKGRGGEKDAADAADEGLERRRREDGAEEMKGGSKKKGGRFLTPCSTDDDCAELEGTSCIARPQKEGATKEAKFFCRDPDAMRPEGGKKGGKGNKGNKGKGKGRGGYKDLDAAAADTDADADGERQRREDGDEETKGSNKNKGGNKKKGGRFLTPCSTDDDCAELEGTSCVARPQKEGATKEAKFFCRDPDAIRPSKGKGKGRSKGKGNGNGGNKAVVDGSD